MDYTLIGPIAIFIAAILNQILGALWYSPKFLGNAWASILGLNEEFLKPTIGKVLSSFGISVVTAWVLSLFLQLIGATTIAECMIIAFFLWLGFIATTHLSGVIWAHKPFKAYLIDTLFALISLEAMAIVLSFWL
ncbi:MAG: DUF1761 domain-containing protein [Parachlamydiaceae bacterium]|nr:DUF1761 domain-containing protein [Parachlamydiaceae bacterium]